jgi:hypothetical protein
LLLNEAELGVCCGTNWARDNIIDVFIHRILPWVMGARHFHGPGMNFLSHSLEAHAANPHAACVLSSFMGSNIKTSWFKNGVMRRMVFPLCNTVKGDKTSGNHWAFVVWDIGTEGEKSTMTVYDSIKDSMKAFVNRTFKQVLTNQLFDKLNKGRPPSGPSEQLKRNWTRLASLGLENMEFVYPTVPLQGQFNSCGFMTCYFAMQVSLYGCDPSTWPRVERTAFFDRTHTRDRFRRAFAACILRGQLVPAFTQWHKRDTVPVEA